MKNMKKLAVLVLAFVMVMSMATTGFAADVVNGTSHSYKAYQIFSGTQDISEEHLGNIVWGNGINGDALLADLKEKTDKYDACTTAKDVAGILVLSGSDGDYSYLGDAREFANIAVNHILNAEGSDMGVAIAADATTVDLLPGYYLIVDVTETLEDGDAYNPALLQVTNLGAIDIAKKYDVPTVDKDIENSTVGSKDESAVNIGDTVEFSLKTEIVENLETYETYKLVFHDEMSAGLTFNPASVKVSFGAANVDPSEYTVVTNTTEKTYYTVVTDTDCDNDENGTDCTFHVVFNDIKAISGLASDMFLRIDYTADVNENAKINTGDPNKVNLEFSNDPNWDPDDHEEGEEPPTGVTPWDEVIVYTTEVQLKKVDGTTNSILTGAEFTLTGQEGAGNVVIVSGEVFEPWTDSDTGTKYWLLKDGTYTEQDPDGKIDGKDVDTTNYVKPYEVYKKVAKSSMDIDEADVEVKAFVGADGIVKFTGLGLGSYILTESVTPGGYNTIEPIELTITWKSETKEFHYSWGGGATQHPGNTAVVQNFKGSVLPETGGVGTTMFYVGGGLMMAAAAILLISKKRKAEEN